MSASLEKIKKHFLDNLLFYCIFFVLLILPFFWFSNNLYILGNDDTGLEFYNPLGSLQKFSSLWYSSDGLANFNQSIGSETVFSLILYLLRLITFQKINLQILAYSFIIGFSFYYITKILELLNNGCKSLGFYIAGLFYSLSSYFFITEYVYTMPSTFLIVLAPIITYYMLEAIKTKSDKPLLIAAIWSFIFSRAFFTPMSINFLTFLFLFTIVWTYFKSGKRKIAYSILKYLKYIIFTILINAIVFIPFFYSVFTANNDLKDVIANKSMEKNFMVDNLKTEFGVNKIKDYLMNIFPEEIAKKGHATYPLYKKYINTTAPYVYIIVILAFIGILIAVRKKEKIAIPVLIMFLLTLTFVSVDIFPLFGDLYVYLMTNTPMLTMNRYPSLKFSIPFVFYYSLLIGLGLSYFLEKIKLIHTYIVFIICITILFASNYPSFTGLILSDNTGLITTSRPMDFNKDYKKLIRDFPSLIKDDSELLLFPLGYGYGAFIAGENEFQVYRSQISGFKNFTGHNLFGNLTVMNSYLDPSIYKLAKKYYFEQDLQSMFELVKKINIKYIIYTKNIEALKSSAEIIPKFTFKSPNYFGVVKGDNPIYENGGYLIYKVKNYDEVSRFTTQNQNTNIYFSKIADFMYTLKIRTSDTDRLIFHTRFSNNWKLKEIDKKDFKCFNPKKFSSYYSNIYECEYLNDNIAGNLQLLGKMNINNLSIKNEKYDSYLNSWNINTHGDYRYFILVIDSQKYFIIGSIVSLPILILYYIVINLKKFNNHL